MTRELEILKSVESKNTVTQRELAQKTGLSLGAVNILLKRLINKGLLKIEQINSRTIKYMLTPKGFLEKARLTYQYIVISYNHISNIENTLEQIIENKQVFAKIGLYGEKDELYEIISSKLKSMNEPYIWIDSSKLHTYKTDEYIVLTWNPECIEQAIENTVNTINILSKI